MKNKLTSLIFAAFLIFSILPYWIAVQSAGPEHIFGGFLFNPIDGNSYLAKIVEGQQGAWKFTFPFTAEPGSGSYLFLFYLFLGHLSRWLSIAPLWIYHIARVLSAIFLIWCLWKFTNWYLPEKSVLFGFALASLGSGLGWLGLLFGWTTADFTVAEAYPFLSAYANPHFPLSLGLILWLFSAREGNETPLKIVGFILGGLFLGILLPFGAVIVIVISGILAVWNYVETRRLEWKLPVLVFVGSVPMLVYQFYLTRTDLLVKAWNVQNLTPSPAVYDVLIALSPALIFAILGAISIIRLRQEKSRLLLVWAIASLILMYIPFSLQRRFMLGIYIPIAGLAAIGVEAVLSQHPKALGRASFALLALSIPTSFLILLIGLVGALRQDPIFYMQTAEGQGMDWLSSSVPKGSVVLAAPETSIYIPGHTGDRVVYGHPFETIQADKKQAWVQSFYQSSGHPVASMSLKDQRVDYIWVGPRERALGFSEKDLIFPIVYQQNGVTIYQANLPK
jgi:hypothetical protein